MAEILMARGIQTHETAVVLHRPSEPGLRGAMAHIIQNRREIFEAYQSFHSKTATATLRRRAKMLSFAETEPGEMVFVGFYAAEFVGQRPSAEINLDPSVLALHRDYGMDLWREADNESQPWFDVKLLPEMADLAGRLRIRTPEGRAYVRLAENLDAEVISIERASRYSPPFPGWRKLCLKTEDVRFLPNAWATRLREWRGIYLIVDESDGARYVGSAYGAENILGRWQQHCAGEVGVTVELERRDTSFFRFSILERVSPDMPPEDIIAIEHTWMERLHTRQFGLNA
ncbi:GIY-YIG nuclease family protein [Antarctobacter heliothermus]|uniref:GIY-YIG nuclease family protein n=1 Tax=Antarctobacter heliothermus TaxID=74033 RepID=UPI0012FE761F|nr:GIY-YIG nuclease family protein [Antarctobacter heliothermus]